MQIKIIDIPAQGSEAMQEQLNKFLRLQKILDIDRKFYVSSDNVGHWSLFITYLPTPTTVSSSTEKREKVDYKELLSEADFDKFVKLRLIRKQLAVDDAVPAYAVFTDAELAQIAQLSQVTLKDLQHITGLGEKRIEKYGKLLCAYYNEEI